MRDPGSSRRALQLTGLFAVLILLVAACAPAAPAPPAEPAAEPAEAAPAKDFGPELAEMIEMAAAEGEIVFQGPDPAVPGMTSADMLRDMSAVVQQHFGVDINIRHDPSLSFPASTARVLTEIEAGAPPSYDLMYQTAVSGSPLYAENAVEQIDWLGLFPYLTEEDLQWRGQALINQTLFVLPVYNTRLIEPDEVPNEWDDLLDPKWRGRLGALIYMDPWIVLSQPDGWGRDMTRDYLTRLVELEPRLGRFPEAQERVVSGETPMSWGNHIERAIAAKEAGAPVDFAPQVEPALAWVNILFVPRGARSPNAAALVAAAMLTDEGQELQLKYQNATSMFRPNTPAQQFAQEHQVLMPDVDWQLEHGPAASEEYEAILIRS